MPLSGDTPQALEDLAFEKNNSCVSDFQGFSHFWLKMDNSGAIFCMLLSGETPQALGDLASEQKNTFLTYFQDVSHIWF